MGRFKIAATECNYQELDRWVKEQFIHKLNDDSMLMEIIQELTANKDTSKVTRNQVLIWAR